MKKTRPVFIIAEAGVNHNGSLELAKRLVDEAKKAGADAVKFQTFKGQSIATSKAEKAEYQKARGGHHETQSQMLKKLELKERDHIELLKHCRKRKIEFISSPFDLPSIDLLNRLGLKVLKIPSGEITNLPYLRKIGALNKTLILSTGMADMKEIRAALEILTSSGTKKNHISVLHCTTEYPAPYRDVNLAAMRTIRDAFQVKVGYSDHTLGSEVAIAAAALGATVIEKHFTLDKKMAGPDHKASLEPRELRLMIRAIRNVEAAIGDGIKKPSRSELKNIVPVRKSIVAAGDIKKGELLTESNVMTKRPGNGLSPMHWDGVIGKRASRNYAKDDFIRRR
jgi:N,N'-diacetyllegionaminate synthase